MKNKAKHFLILILTFIMASGLVSVAGKEEVSADIPLLSGLFIAPELCTGKNSWTQSDWDSAFEQMKNAKLDTAVIQYSVQYYSDTYKVHYYNAKFEELEADNTGKHDQIPFALSAAKKHGIKVYLGLHIAESPWFAAMSAGFGDETFLTSSYEYSKQVFDDLWGQFSGEYGDVIEGWYLPFEYNNSEVAGQAEERLIEKFYVPMTSYLKKVTPQKKILVSPLVYAPIVGQANPDSVKNWYKLSYDMWTRGGVDIIAPQDGCGWESTVKDTLDAWYKALSDACNDAKAAGKSSAEAWNNPECYNMNGTSTMTVKRLTSNMAAVDKYVSAHISFSAASLLYLEDGKNGVSINNKCYYDAYSYLVKNRKYYQPSKPIDTPKRLSAKITDGVNVTLKWSKVKKSGDMDIAGYYIFRKASSGDYQRIKEIEQPKENTVTVVDYNLSPKEKYDYRIFAFDATGNLSKNPAEISVSADGDVPVAAHKNKGEIGGINLSVGELVNCTQGVGSLSCLTDGKSAVKLKDTGTDNGSAVLFSRSDEKPLGMAQITVKSDKKNNVGFIYLQMLNQPTKDVYLPERVDIKNGKEILKTVYPLREYGNSPAGEVWIPIDFENTVSTDSLSIDMLMKNKFIAVSEIKVFESADVKDADISLQNKLSGQPVMITNYETDKNFSPDAHFGGVQASNIDYEKGSIQTNYIMFKECYSTYNLTRGTSNPAMLNWTQDNDRSHWLSIANIGASYELKADFKSPTTVKSVETVWMYDRDAAVYLPVKIEYYGTTVDGHSELIGTTYPPSLAKIDFDKEPSENNTHFASIEKYSVVNPSPEKVYKQITAKVFPEYEENTQFISNFTVY